MNTLCRVLVLANEQIPPCISLSTDTKFWFSEFKRVSWTGNNGNPSYVSSRKAAVWAVSFWFHEWPNRAHRSPGVGSSQVVKAFILSRHCHYLDGRNALTTGLKSTAGSLWHFVNSVSDQRATRMQKMSVRLICYYIGLSIEAQNTLAKSQLGNTTTSTRLESKFVTLSSGTYGVTWLFRSYINCIVCLYTCRFSTHLELRIREPTQKQT